MNVLVTSSRMPFAINLIRKLGKQGHAVFTSDTFASAPGSHSHYVTEALVTASPRFATDRFIDDLARIVETREIDLVLPAFEEVFYLARHRKRLEGLTRLFIADFDLLARLHDKAAIVGLARELGVRVPETRVVTDAEALRAATAELGAWFARPVFSRGGVELLANRGVLAGARALEEARPSPERPWLVQAFVEGVDYCTYGVAHHGKLTAHSAYVHPRTLDHVGGIAFESVDSPALLEMVRRMVEGTGYHGQISFDFIVDAEGPVLIECNPRPTAGITVMTAEAVCDAIFGEPDGWPRVAPAGVRTKFSLGLVRDMVVNWRELPGDLEALFSDARDVYAEPGNLLPALYAVISYAHVSHYRRQLAGGKYSGSDLLNAYFFDICWDGEDIPLAS